MHEITTVHRPLPRLVKIMVIGLLAITAIPTVIGVGQAISAQKKQNAAVSKEQEKFHMVAQLDDPDEPGVYEDAAVCIVKDKKAGTNSWSFPVQQLTIFVGVYLNLPDLPVAGHRFCGYYFKYPSEEQHLGLVTTISDDPPMLNWVYVNKDTHVVEFGGRKDTLEHVIGPWGWSEDEKLLTLEGNIDSFVAVREEGESGEAGGAGGRWHVCWDPEEKMLAEMSPDRCRPVRLRRQPLLGMESRYVRDSER
ncbi:LOW QUALITY PROTEIN: hypothetical protein HJFPF1_04019 [Paramyrothecium foliicola]|nr:LOW QUALITY PROTEIN: hypothetical protein HJFPF1_04019 [Paramyrothecium foliicola]